MHLSLRFKLALVLLLVSALVVTGTALLAQWSFERAYVRQVEARQLEQVQATVAALAEEFSVARGWSRVQRERRRWLQILFAGRGTGGRVPRWAQGFEIAGERRWPPRPQRERHDSSKGGERVARTRGERSVQGTRRVRLQMRMMLLGANRELLIGQSEHLARLQLTPIVVDAVSVGFLGVLPGPALHERSDIRFVDEQKRRFLVIGAAFVLLAAVLAFPLSNALTARVRAIATAARELATGNYAARVELSSHDELGRLASDFNDLAMALARTERSRREWVADISHELRTPLATMRAEVEALQDGVRPLSLQAVDSLHLDVMRLGRLVDDLYLLSRSDLGALIYHKESLDPSAVLRVDLQALSTEFEKQRIAIELNVDAGLCVHGDADRLAQLFRNILTNSLRYTDADGRLKIDVVRNRNWVVVSFEDSSPGVPAADLPHLLERFHRVDRSRNRGTGGAGLGLAICESIAVAHGGRIEVRHGLLGGLGVHVWLPVNSPFTVKGDVDE
ncbi:MAG: two-component system sensor histidine kinase BaeS [Gammaproteobacteria bacterium]|jgi:two-component system sensor histidine kinase BaeS